MAQAMGRAPATQRGCGRFFDIKFGSGTPGPGSGCLGCRPSRSERDGRDDRAPGSLRVILAGAGAGKRNTCRQDGGGSGQAGMGQRALRRPSSLVKLCQTLQFKKIFWNPSRLYPPKSGHKIFTPAGGGGGMGRSSKRQHPSTREASIFKAAQSMPSAPSLSGWWTGGTTFG